MAQIFSGSVMKSNLTTGVVSLSDYTEDDEVIEGSPLTEDQIESITEIGEIEGELSDGAFASDDNFDYVYYGGEWYIGTPGGGSYGGRYWA